MYLDFQNVSFVFGICNLYTDLCMTYKCSYTSVSSIDSSNERMQPICWSIMTCADQGGGGGRGPDPTPEKSQNIGFLSKTDMDPLKIHKAAKPAFNNGPSLACQRNAIEMAFRWRADDGPK